MIRLSSRSQILLLGFIALFSLGIYLLFSSLTCHLGFPLDDAWIHQTYARNLVEFGQWSFIPYQPSAGSTAPLWSAILAVGYALRLGPYIWTFLVGWLTLWALSIVGYSGFRFLAPDHASWTLWAALGLALEWHLVWAAASGMETLLFALIILWALVSLVRVSCARSGPMEGWKVGRLGQKRASWLVRNISVERAWLGLGALVGISVWLRPDGVTLVGPAGLVLLTGSESWRGKLRIATIFALGFIFLAVPYLLFNRALAGSWWPNTFYAKQAEYAILRLLPFWRRYRGELILPLVGAGALLIPGFVFALYRAIRRRSWPILAAGLWFLGYTGIYAWRLPVTYQHGRYVIPAVPVFFLVGLLGTAELLELDSPVFWQRISSRAWIAALGAVLGLFWVIGARTYANDVAIIETEMVSTAKWVAENTPSDALIAAHDIGALGYFGQRDLLDLAGLVSPEVIPFIRDEIALERYLDAEKADYLVTFPDWYPVLSSKGEMIFQTNGQYSLAQGGENMAVYRWHSQATVSVCPLLDIRVFRRSSASHLLPW
jgi:arabinofuranosyltransferase